MLSREYGRVTHLIIASMALAPPPYSKSCCSCVSASATRKENFSNSSLLIHRHIDTHPLHIIKIAQSNVAMPGKSSTDTVLSASGGNRDMSINKFETCAGVSGLTAVVTRSHGKILRSLVTLLSHGAARLGRQLCAFAFNFLFLRPGLHNSAAYT